MNAVTRLALLLLIPAAANSQEPDRQRIAALVDQLASDDFFRREEAEKELRAIGGPAASVLRQAAATHEELEVRFRAGQLLAQIQKILFTEVARFQGHNRFPGDPARGWISRSAVSPDGERLYTIGGDALREWNVATRTLTRTLGQFDGIYFTLALSRDGTAAITAAASDGAVAVWDLAAGNERVRLKGHTALVWGAAFTEGGKQAITGAWDKSIRVWDLSTGQEVRQFEGVKDHVRCLALSPDGTKIAAGHFGEVNQPGTLRIWDVASGKELVSMPGHTLEITSVAFAPDGSRVLTSSFDKTVRLWQCATGKLIRELKGHTGLLEMAAFSPDGQFIYSVGEDTDRTLRIWETETGENIFTSDLQPGGFLSVTPLPDNERVVTTGKDGAIKIWKWNR